MSPVVVFAAGNDARGDDAIGPVLLAWIESRGWTHVRTVFDFQFQVEHALDLDGAALALFIDAHAAQARPVLLTEIVSVEAATAGTHALSPAQVMGVHRRVSTAAAPPSFVLSVAGDAFGLGEVMSATASAAVDQAKDWLATLLTTPDAAAWRALARR